MRLPTFYEQNLIPNWGINFDSATRTIGDWVIEVEDTVDNL